MCSVTIDSVVSLLYVKDSSISETNSECERYAWRRSLRLNVKLMLPSYCCFFPHIDPTITNTTVTCTVLESALDDSVTMYVVDLSGVCYFGNGDCDSGIGRSDNCVDNNRHIWC